MTRSTSVASSCQHHYLGIAPQRGRCIRCGDEKAFLWIPLSEPQRQFLAATEFELLYGGAKGGAKTDSLIAAPLSQIGNGHFRGLLLRSTWDEVLKIMPRLDRIYGAAGGRYQDKGHIWTFQSGATITLGYFVRQDSVKHYTGYEWTYIGIDEAGDLADAEAYAKLTADCRSPDKTLRCMVRITANPGGVGHAWIKQRFVSPTDYGRFVSTVDGVSRRFIPAKVTDNPIYRDDPDYLARLMALPDRLRRQLLDGDWDAAEGLALDELSRAVHMPTGFAREVPAWWYQWGALDIGYGHCWCFMWGAMSPDGYAYIVDSLHGQRDRYDEVARRITEQGPAQVLRNVVCDNYARQEGSRGFRDRTPSVMELFSEYGIQMAEANQRRVLGLNNLRLWLGWRLADGKTKTPRLRFFDTPGNRVTFACLERMVVDPKNAEDVLKVHADDRGQGGDDPYDTCLAGDTLVRTARGWDRIDALVGTTGKCLTPMGWMRYTGVRQTRDIALVSRIRFDDGTSVTATPDHEFLTPRGWRYLDDLCAGAQCIQLSASDRRWAIGAGLSGPNLLATSHRILPASATLPAPRRLRSELRADPGEASDPSSGRRPGEQPAGEPGSARRAVAFAGALGRGTTGMGAPTHRSDSADDESVACVARRPTVAQTEWCARDGDAADVGQALRAVRQGIPVDPEARAVLPSELQDDVLPPRGPYRLATVVAIEIAAFQPVYNLEVETAHCFAVNGGIVVHNCRYLMAAHPYVPSEPRDPEALFEPDRDTQRWPAPNEEAPDDDPNPETIGGLSYGF